MYTLSNSAAVPPSVVLSVFDKSVVRCKIPGQVYTECASACPPTCDNPQRVCPNHCVPGCQCPRGTVLLGERCVLPKNCEGEH